MDVLRERLDVLRVSLEMAADPVPQEEGLGVAAPASAMRTRPNDRVFTRRISALSMSSQRLIVSSSESPSECSEAVEVADGGGKRPKSTSRVTRSRHAIELALDAAPGERAAEQDRHTHARPL